MHHRVSHLLSDYCLFCIVLCSGQMPRATEHNTGHNGRTLRGADLAEKHTHRHTFGVLIHIQHTHSHTYGPIKHIQTFTGINTHFSCSSKAQSWHNNGRQRAPDSYTSPYGFGGGTQTLRIHTSLTKTHKGQKKKKKDKKHGLTS